MSRNNWGNEAYDPRDQPAPEPRTVFQERRKQTKQWCRGKVGKPHTTEIVVHHGYTARERTAGCSELSWWRTQWWCLHSERCTRCGKYTRRWLPREDCPTWQKIQASG